MDRMKPFMISLSTLLLFTCILSLIADPLPRTLALWHHEASVMEKTVQERATEVPRLNEGGLVNERMNMEINDYPGSGANTRHDPKNPGRS